MREKDVREILADRFKAHLVSAVVMRVDDDWFISGLGPVTTDDLVTLVMAASLPKRKPSSTGWWTSFFSTPSDEREIIARNHIWLIRMRLEAILSEGHTLMRDRFQALSLLERLVTESRNSRDV